MTNERHVCDVPHAEVGVAWICPECWCTYIFRPVAVSELNGRVLNLWVLSHRPGNAASQRKVAGRVQDRVHGDPSPGASPQVTMDKDWS